MYLNTEAGHMPEKTFKYTHKWISQEMQAAQRNQRVVNAMAGRAQVAASAIKNYLMVKHGNYPRIDLAPLLIEKTLGKFRPAYPQTILLAQAMVQAYEKSGGRSDLLGTCIKQTLLHELVHYAYFHKFPVHQRNDVVEPERRMPQHTCVGPKAETKKWELGEQFEIEIYGCPAAIKYGPTRVLKEVARFKVEIKEPPGIGW